MNNTKKLSLDVISDRSEFDNNITMIPITTARYWCILHDILIVQASMN